MTKVPVFNIDSGVPVPAVGPKTRDQVPVHLLEVGDSILFPLSLRRAVTSIAQRLKESDGKKFTIKKMDDNNARIWRVE
jgi:hypothetical protein